MIIEITIDGTMNDKHKLEITMDSNDSDLCLSVKGKEEEEEIDLYVEFDDLKKALNSIESIINSKRGNNAI